MDLGVPLTLSVHFNKPVNYSFRAEVLPAENFIAQLLGYLFTIGAVGKWQWPDCSVQDFHSINYCR